LEVGAFDFRLSTEGKILISSVAGGRPRWGRLERHDIQAKVSHPQHLTHRNNGHHPCQLSTVPLRVPFHCFPPSEDAFGDIVKTGEFSRPCSGVIAEETQKRSLFREDEAPAETRGRRTRKAASNNGRETPETAPETARPTAEESLRRRMGHTTDWRSETARRRWWLPKSKPAKILLGTATLLVLGAAIAGYILVRRFLEQDSHFRISSAANIETTGMTQVSRDELLPVFGEDLSKNIFKINLSERQAQVEQLPWVEHATVMRLLPDRIRIQVTERTPVAIARLASGNELIDASGVLLSMTPQKMASYSFPVITGITATQSPDERLRRMRTYMHMIADLDSGKNKVSKQISEIDLTNPNDARVMMPEAGGDILAHFGDEHFLLRYQHYEAHINEWRAQYPHLNEVDLRYGSQVVLNMATPSDAAASGSANGSKQTNANAADSDSATAKSDADKPEKKAVAKPDGKAVAKKGAVEQKSGNAKKSDTKAGQKTPPKKEKSAASTAGKGKTKNHPDAKRTAADVKRQESKKHNATNGNRA